MCILNFNLFYQTILFLDFWTLSVIFFCMDRLFDIYEPGMCHFIDHEASLSNALPPLDASHPAYEVIRGDRQCLKSNFLWVYYVYL